MRRFQKMIAASVLISIPTVWASAQEFQASPDRQSGGYRQYGGNRPSNGDVQSNGDRPSRRDRQSGRDQMNNGAVGQPSDRNAFPSNARPDNSGSFTAPAMTGPITFPAQALPKEYATLMTRSIFSKDHIAVASGGATGKPAVFVSATVDNLVLRGAMREGTHFLANIEDTGSSKKITWVSEGDLLTSNGARVTEITLDHIVVEKNGGRRLITIGVSLDAGEKLSPPASVAASASPTASAAVVSRSATSVTASSAGTASDEDVAEMMRRRRLQELGQ